MPRHSGGEATHQWHAGACFPAIEIEKGIAQRILQARGRCARVFGSLLSWLQEKISAVFVEATANNISQLPIELLRRGRWDELWFVDLPNQRERTAIWDIVIQDTAGNGRGSTPVVPARASELHTGAEIDTKVSITLLREVYAAPTRRAEDPKSCHELLNDANGCSKTRN